MAPGFPGDSRVGLLAGDDAAEEVFATRYAGLPCPILDLASGRCELYRHRPVNCRTFGLPVTLAGERLPPCRLCFVGVPAAEEACRVQPDPHGLEAELLDEIERAGEETRQTRVAFAVARWSSPAAVARRRRARRR